MSLTKNSKSSLILSVTALLQILDSFSTNPIDDLTYATTICVDITVSEMVVILCGIIVKIDIGPSIL